MHFIYAKYPKFSKRIIAHRQNWFNSTGIDISKSQANQNNERIKNADLRAESRWKDDYAATRPNLSIFDLIESENSFARDYMLFSESGQQEKLNTLKAKKTNLTRINELLLFSNFQIQLSITDQGELFAERINNVKKYSISMLSDGEKNALLIAANVLTAPKDTILLIDEPERHLHRSITTPFLSQLIKLREDCKFIISTHDVLIPQELPNSQVLVVRDCEYIENKAEKWDLELIENPSAISETVISEILGSRNKILFIEGEVRSLDLPLYSLLFPNISVIPKKSCRDVMHSVYGINGTNNFHRTQAYGLIDNDKRPPEKIEKLALEKIYALKAYSVESIYYNSDILEILAKKQADVIGFDAQEKINTAKFKFFNSIKTSKEDLCIRSVEKTLQNEVDSKNIKRKDIKTTTILSIEINVKEKLNQEISILDEKISAADYQYILDNYPVRSSTALDACTKEIGFQGKEQYEAAVIKLLKDSAEARQIVQQMLSPLYEAVTQD